MHRGREVMGLLPAITTHALGHAAIAEQGLEDGNRSMSHHTPCVWAPSPVGSPHSPSASAAGLKRIHMLTVQGSYELRIDLEDFDNGTAFAHYGSFGVGLFSVDPEEDGYPISIADYSGTAGRDPIAHGGVSASSSSAASLQAQGAGGRRGVFAGWVTPSALCITEGAPLGDQGSSIGQGAYPKAR